MATNLRGRTTRTSARKTNVQARTSTTKTPKRNIQNKCASGYAQPHRQCEQMINNWRTLYNQTQGTAKFQRPSAATLNTFAKWINKGANIHTVTPTQLNRWAGSTNKKYDWTKPTQCKNFLTQTYGKSTIKAISRTKTGSFMVACAPTVKGKPFRFPK